MGYYNFALSVNQPKHRKTTAGKSVRKQNIRNNREKLAIEAVDQMDLKDLTMMMKDQLEIYYEGLSNKEFNEEWNRIF